MDDKIKKLKLATIKIKKQLVELCHMQSIHIGGDLSVAEIMTVLWQYQMKFNPNNIKDEKRDRFILSKGHASAVTSLNQAAIGCFDYEDVLNEYATDEGRFSMHSCNLVNKYVEFSTGSLGHGFPVACGIAAALKLKNNKQSRVYVVMGDGEQAEGSCWEAAMNAVHYNLGNLIAIIDNNGLEADGSINDITGIGDLQSKYTSFGWNVNVINGNCIEDLVDTFDRLPPPTSNIPTIIICHTIKGNSIPFIQNKVNWHAGIFNQEQYNCAIKSLNEIEANI